MDFRLDRPAAPTKDAATVIVVRAASERSERSRENEESRESRENESVEVFCVERNKQTRFMGGAIVFPGGKLDEADRDPSWRALATPPSLVASCTEPFADDEGHLHALAVAAARETLEEAALLHLRGARPTNDELLALRKTFLDDPGALRAFLTERSAMLDLGALVPIGRWVTPVAESRRFDARFFVTVAPEGQNGAHDEQETMASFWASPSEVLRRFDAGEITLMPPTHRMLAILAACTSLEDVFDQARRACLEPICPRLVEHRDDIETTLALVLPGDPEHDVREPRVPGPSRYVRRNDRWLPEDPPRR